MLYKQSSFPVSSTFNLRSLAEGGLCPVPKTSLDLGGHNPPTRVIL
jgi:hypothetical protein